MRVFEKEGKTKKALNFPASFRGEYEEERNGW